MRYSDAMSIYLGSSATCSLRNYGQKCPYRHFPTKAISGNQQRGDLFVRTCQPGRLDIDIGRFRFVLIEYRSRELGSRAPGGSREASGDSVVGGALMMRRKLAFITAVAAMIALVCWSIQRRALGQADNGEAVKQAYEAYVQAWKLKDIAALQNIDLGRIRGYELRKQAKRQGE